MAKYVKENTNIKDLKTYASKWVDDCSKYNEEDFFNNLSNDELKEFEKISAVKILAKHKSEKLTAQLPSIIKDKNVSHETRLAAVWAAGSCKNSENFDLLYKIANNNNAKNLEEREIALHSLSQYLRSYEVQVKETLKNVIKEKSDLSELATILLEKSEGKYYVKDRELASLTQAEKALYKKKRDKYIQTDFKMNIQQENVVDRALSPLRKILSTLLKNRSKIYIAGDTSTRFDAQHTGMRCFYEDPAYGGFFSDAIFAVSNPQKIFLNKMELKSKTKNNTLAHEFNHTFLEKILSKEDGKKLSKLYKNSVEQERCFDSYAKVNEAEYFAQGYEAYCSVYKPYSSIIENNNVDSMCFVRSTIKRKDPELYDFIEYCIKKYNG